MSFSVYIDDLLLTRSDEVDIQAIKVHLQKHINMHDLGTPRYFIKLMFTYQDEKLA